MRYSCFTILIFLGFISCNLNKKAEELKTQDYLTQWVVKNEDSLYSQFKSFVKINSLCEKCDTSWDEKAYLYYDSSTLMGQFTLLVNKYCDSLETTFFYKKNTNYPAKILLSTGYNRKFINALDTLFNSGYKFKHFIVNKYEVPDTLIDEISLQNTNVIIKDVRTKLVVNRNLKDLIVFIKDKPKNKNLDDEAKIYLKQSLFGEELLLKKINNVDFQFTEVINDDLFTITQIRKYLR